MQDQRGISLVGVLVVVGIVSVAAVGAAVAFQVLREPGQAPVQTAKLLPAETQIYVSLNLQPGGDQLTKFREILARFQEHPNFLPKIDDLFEQADLETGIQPEEDILPWLGPEVAIGFIDVSASAVAGATGGTPLVIALVGTTDADRSKPVLRTAIDYIERKEGLSFTTEEYRGLTVFTEQGQDQHYAVADDYLLLASDGRLLRATIDRIQDGDTSSSLFETARFKEALDALPNDRFLTAYVDTEGIWQDARQLLSGALPGEMRRQIDDSIPGWTALSGVFIDKGLDLTLSAFTPQATPGAPPDTNSLASAQLLPSDTLAFLSFRFEPDLAPIRKQLEEQRISDLGPEAAGAFALPFGLAPDPDATLATLLDDVLQLVTGLSGIDIEQDILSWMTGEVGLALLPSDFSKTTVDPLAEAVRAVALLQFNGGQQDTVGAATAKIASWLEDIFGVVGEEVSFGGRQGRVFDISDMAGTVAYSPGYLSLADHLIIATTKDSLESIASIIDGQAGSLADDAGYSRLVAGMSGTRNPLVYLNIRGLTDALVASLDAEALQEYRESVEPFAAPLKALVASGDVQEGVSRSSVTVTIE